MALVFNSNFILFAHFWGKSVGHMVVVVMVVGDGNLARRAVTSSNGDGGAAEAAGWHAVEADPGPYFLHALLGALRGILLY